jgi:hypothetical protein
VKAGREQGSTLIFSVPQHVCVVEVFSVCCVIPLTGGLVPADLQKKEEMAELLKAVDTLRRKWRSPDLWGGHLIYGEVT